MHAEAVPDQRKPGSGLERRSRAPSVVPGSTVLLTTTDGSSPSQA